ncbi:stage II sporulation protein M [Furfurilactobacillus cerevisiae]|uniref:stage II sporulation protein M n=1 Tax=Furfurilactobacillus rossiae TaxID=231049 RepID=UPI003B9857A7
MLQSTNWQNVLSLFERNYGLAWFYVGVAFLPLPCYWLFAIINALTVGIVLIGSNPIATLFLGILPHGIFEITAQILTFCIASQITKYIQQSIRQLYHPTEWPPAIQWSTLLIDMCSIIPLLYVVSAIIETFVTPVLLQNYF